MLPLLVLIQIFILQELASAFSSSFFLTSTTKNVVGGDHNYSNYQCNNKNHHVKGTSGRRSCFSFTSASTPPRPSNHYSAMSLAAGRDESNGVDDAALSGKRGGGNDLDDRNDHPSNPLAPPITHSCLLGKRILVIGGSGRVGGSVVCQLVKHGAIVTVGGTKIESFQKSKSRWIKLFSNDNNDDDAVLQNALNSVLFETVDREDDVLMNRILRNAPTIAGRRGGYDLVVHTAGPFQGKVNRPNGIMKACIDNGVGYIDVCDDYCTACAARGKYASVAMERGVPCIVSTGCWPGVSSLMAKQLTRSVLEVKPHLKASDLTVDFSFFTAGSGGAGATLLVATFLILAEKSLIIVNGRRRSVPAMKEYSKVDFGDVVGEKDVGHLNLLEAASCHDILGIGNVKTLFGTAPSFWNALLGAMAQLPSSWLSNEAVMEKLAIFSLPIVRLVDYFAGATNAMRVDVSCQKDPTVQEMALYAHENLEPCVGECVVAFCAALLNGNVKAGVWFPEEAIDTKEDVAAVLALSSVGAHTLKVKSTCGLIHQDVWG